MKSPILRRIPKRRIVEAKRLLTTIDLEDKMDEILGIIEKVYGIKPWLLSGRSSAFLLSGLIYLIAKRNGAVITQSEIGEAFRVTELTIRNSCRFWKDMAESTDLG